MDETVITAVLTEAISGLRLLEHPFYRRWEAGELRPGELSSYAGQYRHFEARLPGFLETLAASMPGGDARRAVMANLTDELGDPIPHVVRFERFADSVGADSCEPSPAMTALLASYDDMAGRGPVAALAGLAAYECQASEIAASKADGLRVHYGLTTEATDFWDHHASIEGAHSRWTVEALAALDAAEDVVAMASQVVARAWWAFLDERESGQSDHQSELAEEAGTHL